MRNAKEIWDKVKRALEYAHLLDYLLHPAHSDILMLLLLALRWPSGWIALGWILAAYFYLRLQAGQPKPPSKKKRARKNRDHRKCKPPKPVSRKQSTKKRKSPSNPSRRTE